MSQIVFLYSDVEINAPFLLKVNNFEYLKLFPFLNDKKRIYKVLLPVDILQLNNVFEKLSFINYEIGIASFEETESNKEIEQFNIEKNTRVSVDIFEKNSGYYNLKYSLENSCLPTDTVFLFKNVIL